MPASATSRGAQPVLELGAVGFLNPWLLSALAALPVIWWLLRVTPPTPMIHAFPPVRLLARLAGREESPARTPWWLLLLRLTVAAAVIVAGAHPIAQPRTADDTPGPLILIVDNGWTAGNAWPQIVDQASRLLDAADRRGRPAIILPTAPDATHQSPEDLGTPILVSARAARVDMVALAPGPWPADRAHTAHRLEAMIASLGDESVPPDIIWLGDGLTAAADDDGILADVVRAHSDTATLYVPPVQGFAFIDVAPTPTGLRIQVARPSGQAETTATVRAFADDGTAAARTEVLFSQGDRSAYADINVPSALRNRIESLAIDGTRTAGGRWLLDERWRRRAVGLIARPGDIEQPLTGSLFYVARALQPIADVSRAPAERILDQSVSVVVAADPDPFDPAVAARIAAWVEGGGLFVRFAGPRLSASIGESGQDEPVLIPFPLRPGDRAFGGALTWEQAAGLAAFEDGSPFFGLKIPKDVTVTRQVLTQPSIDVEANTWARLADGTPLVTARRSGDGWIVLMHVTANAEWSSLPLSGLFVEMLDRMISLSAGVDAPPANARLMPERVIDGRGLIGPPPPEAFAIDPEKLELWQPEPRHPPGLYATAGFARALNLRADAETYGLMDVSALGIEQASYGAHAERDLRGVVLGMAAVLFLIDLVASLAFRGLLPGVRKTAAVNSLLVVILIGLTSPVTAQDGALIDDLTASLSPRIAYVQTGDTRVDAIVTAGLQGLTTVVRRRTAAELGTPEAVDPERDDLSLYPLIYWPLVDGQVPPSTVGAEAVRRFLATGGMIVFDTRNAGGGGAGQATLRRLAEVLDLPPLSPVAQNHVLRRSFFLLRSFPGRWRDGPVWVDAQGATTNDGVASIVAGGNDWAAAWALDDHLRPLVAVVPGGERQREMAFRFGINLVMYALTGNYKEDQVHIPEILRRLGQ